MHQLPASTIEFAIVGRSNVGKSSLINALANRKRLARTSGTPGATQLINIYRLEDAPDRWLVDLPGYGFAKAPRRERDRWAQMIEEYLTERSELAGVIVLIDGLIGPTALDLQMVEWVESIGLPYRLVATKYDKVRPAKRVARRRELSSKLGVDESDIRWVSATTGAGVNALRDEMRALLVD